MDFSISEEQSMLSDSIAKFIENDYDFETRQKIAAGDLGYSADLWATYAELGWTAVLFEEKDGGLDGGPIELMLMMQQFGKGLLVEPFLANIVLAGGALRRSPDSELRSKWLAKIIDGSLQASLAFTEPQARFAVNDITTTAESAGDSYKLDGVKSFVLNGGIADLLVIPARTAGGQSDEDGITLFAVPADSVGVSRRSYKTVDAQQAAEISLKGVVVNQENVLGKVGDGLAILQATIDEATFAVCAEAVGIIRTMHDKTVEYTKNRLQFGVPIGSFQALQHRMVETLIACEQSQSLLYWSAMINAGNDSAARKSVSALKYQIGTAGVHVAKEAVQLHGGMGVTWELDIAHYFKRLTAISILFGDADFHLDRHVQFSKQSVA